MELKNSSQNDNARILIVDDEQYILDLFDEIISPNTFKNAEKLGLSDLEFKLFGNKKADKTLGNYELVKCQQGEDAIQEIERSLDEDNPFAIIFLDVRMPPGMNGISTAEKIRELDQDVEIVLITGYSDLEPRDFTSRIAPAHKLLYIQKPFHPQEIQQFIFALSAKWHLEKQLWELQSELQEQVHERTMEYINMNEKLQSDISDFKKTQNQLQASMALSQLITDNMTEMVAICNLEGKYQYISSSYRKVLGYYPENLLGKTILSIIHPEDATEIQNGIGNSSTWDEAINGKKVRFKHYNGHYTRVEALARKHYNSSGDAEYVIFNSRELIK